MIEKRGFFNNTKIENYEFQNYKHSGFLNEDDLKFERIIYTVLFAVYNVVFVASLFFFYKIRNSAAVRERGFKLTFFGGIITFINAFLGFIPQMVKVPCPLSVYNANIFNVLVNLIFFARTLRLVLLYYFDGFADKQDKNSKNSNHLPIINNKVNRILALVISVPALISFIITVALHAKYYEKCRFDVFRDAMLDLKTNNGRELFYVVQVFSGIYMILSLIMSILLFYVKDANRYGAKFEMLSTCILIIVISVFNIILQKNATGGEFEYNGEIHNRLFLNLFEITKGGKMLFTFLSIYMLFASITLPVIQFYRNKKNGVLNDASYYELKN